MLGFKHISWFNGLGIFLHSNATVLVCDTIKCNNKTNVNIAWLDLIYRQLLNHEAIANVWRSTTHIPHFLHLFWIWKIHPLN